MSTVQTMLERARVGDSDAFAALVAQHERRLQALACRLLGRPDLVEDALQEAYVRAFRGLSRFRGQADFGTWLYRITYNVCMDELRRRRRQAVSVDSGQDRPAVPDAPDPADFCAERHALAAALARLTTRERSAVVLVDGYGMGYVQAAEILGVAPGTVGSRVFRARGALRQALEAA